MVPNEARAAEAAADSLPGNERHSVFGVRLPDFVPPSERSNTAVKAILAVLVTGPLTAAFENGPERLDAGGLCHFPRELLGRVTDGLMGGFQHTTTG